MVLSPKKNYTALEDSKAAPHKLVCQPFAKNQKLAPQVPQTSHFVVICVTMSDLEDSNDIWTQKNFATRIRDDDLIDVTNIYVEKWNKM